MRHCVNCNEPEDGGNLGWFDHPVDGLRCNACGKHPLVKSSERTTSKTDWDKAEKRAAPRKVRCRECGETGHTYKTCAKWLQKERHAI